MTEFCARHGILVNGRSKFHGEHLHRPLALAACHGFVEMVEKLLQLGALLHLADGEGRKALHVTNRMSCMSVTLKCWNSCQGTRL